MKYKLSEIGRIVTGKTPSAKNKTSFSEEPDKYLFVTPRDMNGSEKTIKKTERYLTDEVTNTTFKNLVINDESICVSCIGTIGKVFMPSGPAITNQQINSITEIKNFVLPDYLYYYLTIHQKDIENLAGGTTMPIVNKTSFEQLKVEIPDLETQKKIVRILSALDQKIELNNQQNETLFELGRLLYVEKFENNEAIDKVELKHFFPVVTGKKDANVSSEKGKYPFFTCSKAISRIDDYVFDADAILLAGNGDFNVKFYRGKFDAYQRTYVLIPNNPEYLGFLYWAISCNLPKLTANYRGSVIKFITKGNIESFKVPFVENEFILIFMKYLEKIEKNNRENETLVKMRDALLPKLISGEIKLDKINKK